MKKEEIPTIQIEKIMEKLRRARDYIDSDIHEILAITHALNDNTSANKGSEMTVNALSSYFGKTWSEIRDYTIELTECLVMIDKMKDWMMENVK